jgi:hypothetical protein
MSPDVTVDMLEKVLVEYPYATSVSLMNTRPTYSYVVMFSPPTLVVKGAKTGKGVEMLPMHALAHSGPNFMPLYGRLVSES